MSQLLKHQYEKFNATFATGAEAFTNKNSLFPPELEQATVESDDLALADGILLEPKYFEWNQETFVLNVCRVVSSASEYMQTRTYNSEETIVAATEAGWTFMGAIVTDL
jgi:hypothetical protein